MRHPASFLPALMMSLVLTNTAYAQEPQWTFKSPLGNVDSSPAVADLDGDGLLDIVITTTAGSTIALDSQGRQMWMRGVQIPISIPPTVVNLLEDIDPEILVLNQSGRIYCMAGRTGALIWQYDLPSEIEWGSTAIAAHDLDGDGTIEIIAGDDSGHVVCISAEGERIWQYDGVHGVTYCPAIGPVGSSSEPRILIGGAGAPLICLDADGKERWRVQGQGKGTGPVIADIDNDGQNEIITTNGNELIAVDGDGNVLWTFTMPREIDNSISVADANEDGVQEIYAVDLSGFFVALSPEGAKLWSADLHQRVRRSPTMADVDGDDVIEILVAGYSGEMFVFSGNGELEATIPMPHNTNASPTIADLSNDGTPYVIYASTAGSTIAYKWPQAKPNSKILWPEYRFNSTRRATFQGSVRRSPIRITDAHFGNLYGGSNVLSVDIYNPEKKALRIELSVHQTGRDSRLRIQESSEERIHAQTQYSLSNISPVTLQVACRVYQGDRLVAQRAQSFHVVPFQKELADLQRLLDELAHIAAKLPDSYATQGRIAQARTALVASRRRAVVAGTMTDVERRALRDDLASSIAQFERSLTLSKTAVESYNQGLWPIRLAAANPWAPFGELDEIIEGRLSDPVLTVEAFSGEKESAALNIFNFGAETLMARIELEPLVPQNGTSEQPVQSHKAIVLHEVIQVPAQTLDFAGDALPRMNQGHILTLPQKSARQIWLSVDTAKLSPGTWTTTLRIQTLERDPRTYTAPLTVTVWDAPLPEQHVLKHCNWGYVSSSRLKDFEEETLLDRIDHGNNVFVTGFVPRGKYDEKGEIVGEIDYTAHDEFVRRYAPHGLILFQTTGGLSGPGGRDSDAFRKAHLQWLRAWVAHLKDMGIGYDRYAMYPVDEPGLRDGLVDLYLSYARLVRDADPNIQMYTDPVARITHEELEEMIPYVDIWCPNRNGFLLDFGHDKFEIIKNSGAQIWTYECEGNAKHQSPLGYYRGQSWLAWRHGLSGIGFWSYCTSSADPWFRPTNTNDYLLIYQGDGVVTSKRWEAIRDGIEDYDILVTLRQAIANATKDPRAKEAVRQGETILSEGASAIAQFCGLDKDGTVPGKDGLPGVRRLADRRYAAIQDLRREIAGLLNDLTNLAD